MKKITRGRRQFLRLCAMSHERNVRGEFLLDSMALINAGIDLDDLFDGWAYPDLLNDAVWIPLQSRAAWRVLR